MLKVGRLTCVIFQFHLSNPRLAYKARLQTLQPQSPLIKETYIRRKSGIEKESKEHKKAEKPKKNDEDDENRGGGLLEPIIEDIGSWIQGKRPVYRPSI